MTAALRWAWHYLRGELFALPTRVMAIVACLAMLLLPVFVQNPYALRVFALASIWAVFAASWDLLSGIAGQNNLGHALFFGVAAYTSALLNLKLGVTPWLSVPIGALAAVLTGLLVGIPCLRLRGPYLGLATLAFPIMLTGLIFAFPSFTGGELGVSGLTRLAGTRVKEFYLAFSAMLVFGFAMWKIADSNLGIIFHAIREDEIAARASGINTTYYKLLAFCLAGLFAGLAGGMYAHYLRIAGPGHLTVLVSFQAIIWTIFGGVATIYGAIVGVFILHPALELLRVVPEVRTLGFALLVLVLLRFMPEGLVRWLEHKLEEECPRCKIRNAFTRKACRVCGAELKAHVGRAGALRAGTPGH